MRSWRTLALPCYYESKRNQRILISILEPLLLGSYLTLIKKKEIKYLRSFYGIWNLNN